LALNQTQLFPPVSIKKILLVVRLKIECLSTMIIKNNQYKMRLTVQMKVNPGKEEMKREE